MKLSKLLLFSVALLTVNHATLFGASTARVWNPLPARLWAQVVNVPPGSAAPGRPDVTPGTDTTTAQTPNDPVNPTPSAPVTAPVDAAQPTDAFPSTLPAGVPTASPSPSTATPTSTAPPIAAPAGASAVTPVRLPQQEPPVAIPKLPENCKVTIDKTELSIAAVGGPVVFAPRFSPASCATEPVSTGGWLKRVKNSNMAVYSFIAEPNGTRCPRHAAIRVGDVSMKILQAPGRMAPIAAAPSRVELKVGAKGEARQILTVWSDEPGIAFAATAAAPWLKVTSASNAGKTGARKYNIELAPADLKPGLHEGFVEITSPGTTNTPIRIPVVVTIAEKRP